ncbi:signal transduction histidine kinase [Thermonema lapsum]|uniref:histidine kinase n=1 Tax=Thermonema lapsum TaxID=28195 RepID=A0A846MPI3_9BACT|nr:HAMP domain-containing sensor histidine kinase [Thermonema lapsum]NIK73351.1 signal transduction histidine kinase [Thermonema lapsum]
MKPALYFLFCLCFLFESYAQQSTTYSDSLRQWMQQKEQRQEYKEALSYAKKEIAQQDSLLQATQQAQQEILKAVEKEKQAMRLGLVLMIGLLLVLLLFFIQYQKIKAGLEKNKRELETKKSELERSENALIQQNLRLSQLSYERNQIAKTVSKDLRMPFNRIISLVDLLRLDEGYERLTPNQKEYIQNILQVAMDGLNTLQNLIDIRDIEKYREEIRVETFDLVEVVNELLRAYRGYAYAKEQVIQIERNREEIEMRSDSFLVRRIIAQLLSNAIKFSHKHSEIFVRLLDHGDEVVIEVEDEGPGICKEDRERLFQTGEHNPFRNKPTGAESAAGMGLIICKQLVEALHGTIECESEEGRGSLFRVRLPKNYHRKAKELKEQAKV